MTINVSIKDVRPIVSGTFPDYRGRKIRITAASKVSLHNLNWDGGSRCQYRTCDLHGNYLGGADKYNAQAPWANQAEGASIPVPPGATIVRHSIFAGRDAGLTIYVHPDDLARVLPAPQGTKP